MRRKPMMPPTISKSNKIRDVFGTESGSAFAEECAALERVLRSKAQFLQKRESASTSLWHWGHEASASVVILGISFL
jgi:hypothetical protein